MFDFHTSTLRHHERQESAEQAARDCAYQARLTRFNDSLDEFADVLEDLACSYRRPADKWLSGYADQAKEFARALQKVWKDYRSKVAQTDAECKLAVLLDVMIRKECEDYAAEEMERFL